MVSPNDIHHAGGHKFLITSPILMASASKGPTQQLCFTGAYYMVQLKGASYAVKLLI